MKNLQISPGVTSQVDLTGGPHRWTSQVLLGVLLLSFIIPLPARAQVVKFTEDVHYVNNGAKLVLNELSLENSGTIENGANSVITLTGDWWNNGVCNSASSSLITFNGSESQVIGGNLPTTFSNLTLNNAAGFTLGNSQSVSGTLTLTNGLLILGDHNLTLGQAAVGGTPGVGNMIITNGIGECRRVFTSNDSYTFPVGDATGTAEYSPITLNFTSGTYENAYAGVRAVNAKHPDNASSVNYLNRYWSVSSSGISEFRCDVSATYVSADVAGDESAQVAGKYDGSLPWVKYEPIVSGTLSVPGVTGFSDFTGITAAAPQVSITADPALIVLEDELLTLTANPLGDAEFTYSWSPGEATSQVFNPPTSVTGSTVYTLTVTDGNGFTVTASVEVIVEPAPSGPPGPVTTISSVGVCTGATTADVPVKVSAFAGVGSISLKLFYDNTMLGIPSLVEGSLPPGIQAWDNWQMDVDNSGIISISDYGALPDDGVNLEDGSTLFILRFPVLHMSPSNLSFVTDVGTYCEYAGVAPDYPVFNDWPFASYYVPGDVHFNTRQSISGSLYYYNLANTPLTDQVNVELVQKDGPIAPPVTSSPNPQPVSGSGSFLFEGVCPSCTYEIRATSTHPTTGAVNTTDAAQVNYWPTALYPIENGRFYAGDVRNNNNFLNSSDAQRIQSNFVSGTAFDRPGGWSFWKVGETPITSNVGQPPQPVPTVTLAVGSGLVQNIYGLALGDFNRSFNPASMKVASTNLDLVYTGNQQIGSNQEFDLPIRMVNGSEVGAVSLILNFPADLVEVQDVVMEGAGGILDWAVKGDELRIGWMSQTPLNLSASADLVTLRLKTTAAFTLGNSIRISLASDPLNELANGTYDVIGDAVLGIDVIEASSMGIDVPGTESAALTLSAFPNPFKSFTTINYTLPFDGQVTLEVYNFLGMKVEKLVSEEQTAGDHVVKFNTAGMESGVFTATLTLKSNDNQLFRTIKLINNK